MVTYEGVYVGDKYLLVSGKSSPSSLQRRVYSFDSCHPESREKGTYKYVCSGVPTTHPILVSLEG